MKSIFLIRHAETDLAGTFCGHTNPHLNEKGRLQLADLARRLEGMHLDALYTSDLERAYATARALAEPRELACQVRPALREIHFGAWEGLTWQQVERCHPSFAARWLERFPLLPAPGGETMACFEERVLQAFAEAAGCPGQAAVVTHAGVIRVLLERLCGLSPAESWEQSPRCGSILRLAQARSFSNEILRQHSSAHVTDVMSTELFHVEHSW
jgi:alpha-ribazole phosphatase/probable phosphoglycerate mutase